MRLSGQFGSKFLLSSFGLVAERTGVATGVASKVLNSCSWLSPRASSRDTASEKAAMRPREFGIPTVYKPSETVRTLPRLFASYNLLNCQICMLKNTIQMMLTEDVVTLSSTE